MNIVSFVKSSVLSVITLSIIVITFTNIFMGMNASEFSGIDYETDANGNEVETDKFFTRLYFTMTTASTVGYGDIYPVSRSARVTTMILQIIITIGWINGFLGELLIPK